MMGPSSEMRPHPSGALQGTAVVHLRRASHHRRINRLS